MTMRPRAICSGFLTEVDCEVIGEVENGGQAVKAVQELHPDVLVMDISMPGMSGFQAAATILERRPDVLIILASEYADPSYAEEALRRGIKGYVMKSKAGSELVPAIQKVLAGSTFCSSWVPSV